MYKRQKQYDKDLQINYDYHKYKNLQSNILVLNEKFETEKNISFPSRSASSIESMVATDEDTIFLLGSKDNLMSIDRFTGF